MITFMDTCSLIQLQEKAFETPFYVSSISLTELEDIKISNTKDEETKYKVRQVLHLFKDSKNYEIIVYNELFDVLIKKHSLPKDNDGKIIATALALKENLLYGEDIKEDLIFKTADVACGLIARSVGLEVEFTDEVEEDTYTGFKEISMNDSILADFYGNVIPKNENIYNLLNNEYLLVRDAKENKIIDKYKWLNNKYIRVPFVKLESRMFGKITPKDNYQAIAIDSLISNQLTVLRGKPGSGKSYLALSFLIQELERGRIDRIVIFTNTVAVRGAAKLGFYPGSKDSKLLDSQIGNFLATKLGSITEAEKMIDNDQLMLVPIADCRGVDLTGMNAGVLMTESQNTSIDMMKLVLQRIGEDSVCVFEGDDKTQVDMRDYAGNNNGLKRLSEIFRNNDLYGEVNLPNIHRSKIANLAELM